MGGMPHDEKNGVYRYKKGWGGEIKELRWFRKRFRYKKTRDLIKKFFQRN
jgi:lipid II:glycine glycyltransferase (peptidoglycan interpeptide bridge formation enzyme)